MRARSSNVCHLPWARLVAIGAAGQRAYRANIDAHPAFFAIQCARGVGQNHRMHATRAHAERLHIHTFVADTHATEAEDAARSVVKHERRPLLFGIVKVFLGEATVIETVAESHVLQFALATLVAYRAIKRVV